MRSFEKSSLKLPSVVAAVGIFAVGMCVYGPEIPNLTPSPNCSLDVHNYGNQTEIASVSYNINGEDTEMDITYSSSKQKNKNVVVNSSELQLDTVEFSFKDQPGEHTISANVEKLNSQFLWFSPPTSECSADFTISKLSS